MRFKRFSLLIVLSLASVGWSADRSRKEKEKEDKNSDVIDRFALMSVRRVAVVPFVALELPMPVTGFYSTSRQQEEKKKWEDEKAYAAEVAKSVSEVLPKTLTDWKRFEVAEPQAVEQAMSELKLKPSDLVQSKSSKLIVANGEGLLSLKNALNVDALLLGAAEAHWIQYDAEVSLHVQLIVNDPTQPIVSTSVAGRSHRRMKAASQAATLIAMLLYPSRDASAIDDVRAMAVMVLPPPEVLSDFTKAIPFMEVEGKLDELLTRQLAVLNQDVVPPQKVAQAMRQLKISPSDLVSRPSKEPGALPQLNVAKFQELAEKAEADGILVAQILDVETTLSGTGMGLPTLIPYIGTILRSPLFRHKSTYTVLRAQIIAPEKSYPIWTFVTQGMPPRKILQNPRYAQDLERFFSDLSAQIVLDINGQMFASPAVGRR